jgi:hypothetical protein
MTYIVEGVETERVDYVRLYIAFVNTTTDALLHKEVLFEVRVDKRTDVEKVVNSDDRILDYTAFCEQRASEEKQSGFPFSNWKWKPQQLLEVLTNWKNFTDAGSVKVEWVMEDTYCRQPVRSRRRY